MENKREEDGEVIVDHGHFLVLCELLCNDETRASVTFTELSAWTSYVTSMAVQPLYAEGRRLFLVFKEHAANAEGRLLSELTGKRMVARDDPRDVKNFVRWMSQLCDERHIALWLTLREQIRQATLEALDTGRIKRYIESDARVSSLIQMADIMTALGRGHDTLRENPACGKLIIDCVNKSMV